MPTPSDPNTLVAGTLARAADVEAKVDAIFAYLNGLVDNDAISPTAAIASSKMAAAFLEKIGVDGTGVVRRGKSIITTAEQRTNAAYGLMTTPDRVSNLVLPTEGLIVVGYQALMKTGGSGTASAGIFVGGNQLKRLDTNSAPIIGGTEASLFNIAFWSPVATSGTGLTTTGSGTVDSSVVTTGLSLDFTGFGAGATHIWAAPGTYDLTVQFKCSGGGTVHVKERRLWAWTVGF